MMKLGYYLRDCDEHKMRLYFVTLINLKLEKVIGHTCRYFEIQAFKVQ